MRHRSFDPDAVRAARSRRGHQPTREDTARSRLPAMPGASHTRVHTRVNTHTSASARRGLGAGREKPDFPSTPFLPPPIHKPTIK